MISIIVPVYNAEAYIGHCIDSILRSSYGDFEVVLVNDGSTDGSRRVCEEYAARDRRVKLINQENGGVSAARNRGLEVCSGEWVTFVDADDLISRDFLELIARESAGNPDLMLFDYTCEEAGLSSGKAGDALCCGKEDVRGLLRSTLLCLQRRERKDVDFSTCWARALKKSLLDRYGIRFSPDLFIGEDTFFNIEYLLRAESCIHVPRAVYFYNVCQGSVFHRFTPRLPDNHEILAGKVKRALEERGVFPDLKREYDCLVLGLLTFLLARTVFSPMNPQTFREKREVCERFRRNADFREALKRGLRCGSVQQRGFLAFFRMRCYRILSAACRVLHWAWRRQGVC